MDREYQLWQQNWKVEMLKHMISLCNKLGAGPTKSRHNSRLFGQLNRERAKLNALKKMPVAA